MKIKIEDLLNFILISKFYFFKFNINEILMFCLLIFFVLKVWCWFYKLKKKFDKKKLN